MRLQTSCMSNVVAFVGLARSKLDPLNHGKGAEYLYRPHQPKLTPAWLNVNLPCMHRCSQEKFSTRAQHYFHAQGWARAALGKRQALMMRSRGSL